jgi:hypothetical protein
MKSSTLKSTSFITSRNANAGVQPRARRSQGEGELRPLEVLEIVNGTATQAAEREIFWNDFYGYSRGTRYDTHNWSVRVLKETLSENGKRAGTKYGRKAVESDQLARVRSNGGKTQSGRNAESGQLASIASKGGKAGGKVASALRDHCITHNIICAPAPMGRHRKFHSDCVIVRLE